MYFGQLRNPALSRAQVAQQQLLNSQQGIMNQFLGPSLAQQLRQAQLENQIKQAQAQYAPEMEEAKLGVQQATIPHLNAETGYLNEQSKWYGPTSRADIGYKNSETAKNNLAVKYPGLGAPGAAGQIAQALYLAQHPELMQGLNDAMQGGVSPQQQLQSNVPQGNIFRDPTAMPGVQQPQIPPGLQIPAGMAQQSQQQPSIINGLQQSQGQPSLIQNLLQPQGNQGMPQSQQGGQQSYNPVKMIMDSLNSTQGLQQARTGYYNSMSKNMWTRLIGNPEFQSLISTNKDVASNTANVMAGLVKNANGDTSQPNITQKDIQSMADTAGDVAYKKGTTGTIINQQRRASMLNVAMAAGDALMPSVSKYIGAGSKLGYSKDAVRAVLGENSQDYANYMKFTHVVVPTMAGELKATLGLQATDKETKILESVANPDTWATNPKVALEQYQFLMNYFHGGMDKALSKRGIDIVSELGNNSSPEGQQQSQQVRIQNADGKIWLVPSDKANEFLKNEKGSRILK